jgi:tetratricopeptide (TPR) repeat protein
MPKDMQNRIQNNVTICAIGLTIILLTVGLPLASSQTPDAQYMAGCASYLKGDFTGAANNFSLAIMHNNSSDQLFIKRGASLFNGNDVEGAIIDFEEANLINPDVGDLWLARSYALLNDNNKAILFLKKHLNSVFRLPEDSVKKDPAFDKLQVTPEWDLLWQQNWYTPEERVMAEADYYAGRQLYEQAISLLDKEVMQSPENPYLVLSRGKVNVKQGNYAAAIADFSNALNMDKHIPLGYSQRGLAYLKAGRFKDAVTDFNRALKEDPGNFKLYTQRAEAYAGEQAWQPAIKDMLLYIKYFDNDLWALYQCGEYYFESEDYISALKCFNRNLKEDPNNGLYYKARGKTYFKTATYHYAISDLSMSLDLLPDDAETWMYMGIARIKSGDQENGCSSLAKAQKMGNTEVLKYIVDYCK